MKNPKSAPLSSEKVVDLYFLEHRAKVIDVAAFLDRLDRVSNGFSDFRVDALRDAIKILSDGRPDRARRVLELLSDSNSEPRESAAGMKSAYGASKESRPQ